LSRAIDPGSGRPRGSASLRRTGQRCLMIEEIGFPRRIRGEQGRAGRNGSARPFRKANDSSHRSVTHEALDVARYITDMTAQLEAMAIASRLDLLAYFLGMARAESEIYVRTNAVAEAGRVDEQPFQDAIELPHVSNNSGL
jgi:hypothetical protein